MKSTLFTSLFRIKKCFEKLSMTLCPRQSYLSFVLPFQTIKKIQEIRFHDSPRIASAEWHKVIELDSLKLSELVSDSETERLQKVANEIKFATQGINRSPEFINSEQLRLLYKTETTTQRRKFLIFLFKKEQIKLADAKKKQLRRAEKEKCEHAETDDSRKVDLNHAYITNVRLSSMKKFYSKRLANAVLFGRKIVLDLDYDQHMIEKERKACVAQLQVLMNVNRKNIDPFDVHICNANSDSLCTQYLKRYIPNIRDSLVSLTEKNYLDIFPKQNLVYLSPHAKETLKEYDPNAIYVIGAFVDTVKKEHISLHKAESEGIKSYSLPLDDYIMWGAGSKSLTINQAFEIMLTLKNTGDWLQAFECIPSRKIRILDPLQTGSMDTTKKIYLTNTYEKQIL